MTIEFQFTLEDYRDAFRAHLRKGASLIMRWVLRLGLIFGCLFVCLGLLLFVTGERRLNVWFTPALIGAFWIWIGTGGTYLLSAKTQFAKNPSLRQPRHIAFSGTGVKTDAGVASSDLSWKAYVRYVESDKVFLLYTSPACFVIIPKRVLQPGQVDELRQLFQSHIGKEAAVAAT